MLSLMGKVQGISQDDTLLVHGQLSLHGGTVRMTTASTILTAPDVLALRTREQAPLGKISSTGIPARRVTSQAGGLTSQAGGLMLVTLAGSTIDLDGGTPSSSGRAGQVNVASGPTIVTGMITLAAERPVDRILNLPGKLLLATATEVPICRATSDHSIRTGYRFQFRRSWLAI